MQQMEEEDWTDADEAEMDAANVQPDVLEEDGDEDEAALAAAAAGLAPGKKKQQKERKKGVIYISRIPPHLKPQKLRHMLEQHGEIGRLYLAPEAPSLRQKRKRHKGNTGKNFTEGWVEFEDKRVAKQVAGMLNGQPMGGKRRSAYHFDLWCLKYLPKFKWETLTEEIAYQRAVHDQKLAMEISAAKRERDFYLSRVDKSKGIAAIKHRKAQRAEEEGSGAEVLLSKAAEGSQQPAEEMPRRLRAYGQRKPKPDSAGANAETLSPAVLSLIAGKPHV